MQLNKKIAKTPDDLDSLEFKKMKVLVKKEFKRLVKLTSKEKPTQCILLGDHAYTDKPGMVLPLFGKWKGKFKAYAKDKVTKTPLGAIGLVYFDGIDEESGQEIVCISLAKGKGKKKIKEIERKFKKLVPESAYTVVFTEMEEADFNKMEKELDKMPEEEEAIEESDDGGEEDVLTDGMEELGNQISSQAKAIENNLSSDFSADKEPSLNPLAGILKLSKEFWAEVDASQEDNKEALVTKVYAAYADLEKAMYDHWVKNAKMDKAYVDFIASKIAKVFFSLFRGKDNTENGGYGSGKKLNAFAKSYSTYQEINEISTDINKLAEKYENSEDATIDINKVSGLVEDTKTLLKGGYKLKELIKTHYKNSDVCKQLFEALANWESARTEMMGQFTPHLKSYYDVFKSALTQRDTAKEIQSESISLLKSLGNIEKILPKFAEMDEFRKKIEKLDTEKHLSQELAAIKKVEAQLMEFVERMKQMTTDWVNQNLKVLVQQDEELVQFNAILETEKTNLNTKVKALEKKKTASASTDWESFWSTHDQEKADFETLLKTLDVKLKDNNQKRKDLNSAFSRTYEGFAKILEQV